MNKVHDYPFMTEFLNGAFSANSGGKVRPDDEIVGTPEEWEAAEDWWADTGLAPVARVMGQLADEAFTMHEQSDGGDGRDPDEYFKSLPWALLDRYY